MRMHSSMILGGLSGTLLAAAIFLLPGYAATAIVVERESDTYDLLSLTLTRPSVIVLGKFASSLGYFLLIELAILPFIATTMFIVGIDTSAIALSALYLGIVAMTCTSMGVMSSAVARSTPRAVTLAYLSAFIALAGYMVPFGLLLVLVETLKLRDLEPIAMSIFQFFASLSPFGSLGMVVGGFGFTTSYLLLRIALGQGAFSVLALLVARRMLTRPNEERGFTSYSAPPSLPATTNERAPSRRIEGRALPAWPPVRDGANPMLAREVLQVRISQRMTPLRILLVFVCIVPIILILAFTLSRTGLQVRDRDVHYAVHAWVIGIMILMAFLAPGASASAWSREYERETMDLLRISLLTPRQLVMGKVVAALRACMLPLILASIASLPLIGYPFRSGPAAVQFVAGLATIGVTTVECVAISTLMGLFSRRTSACILYGYAASMAAITSPLVISAALSLVMAFYGPDDFLLFWWYLSPVTTYAYELQPGEPMQARNLIVWAVCMIAQLVFSGLVLRAAIYQLAARHLRDP
jgi:ABC-type transport system involved in multi-copper enzyme maturation permease subunit